MAVKPCTACSQRFREKASSVYAAWMGQGGRMSYRASLCTACVHKEIAPSVKKSIARNYDSACDDCGGTGPDDYQLVWLNVYLPKREQEAFELMFCDDCGPGKRADFSRIGIRMKERDLQESRGLANGQDGEQAVPW
jgi:hypothetical protein